MLDGRTGRHLRTIALGAGTGAIRLAVDGRTDRVFVATDVGLRVIDARTGRVLRAIPLPGVRNDTLENDTLEVDQARGRVIVVDSRDAPPYTGYLRILDARTGALARSTVALGAYPVVLDQRWGHVIIGTVSGVRAFDVRTGALSWAFAGGVATQGAVTVDERTGQVFVVDRGVMDASGVHTGSGSVIVLDGQTGTQQSATPVGVDAVPTHVGVNRSTCWAWA